MDFTKDDNERKVKRIRTLSNEDLEVHNEAKKICSKYLQDELQVCLQFETETVEDGVQNQVFSLIVL